MYTVYYRCRDPTSGVKVTAPVIGSALLPMISLLLYDHLRYLYLTLIEKRQLNSIAPSDTKFIKELLFLMRIGLSFSF